MIGAGKAAGLSENAIKKARVKIGAESVRTEFGKDAYYTWVLMDSMDSRLRTPAPMAPMRHPWRPGDPWTGSTTRGWGESLSRRLTSALGRRQIRPLTINRSPPW